MSERLVNVWVITEQSIYDVRIPLSNARDVIDQSIRARIQGKPVAPVPVTITYPKHQFVVKATDIWVPYVIGMDYLKQ